MYAIAYASIFGVLDYGGHLVEATFCRSCFSPWTRWDLTDGDLHAGTSRGGVPWVFCPVSLSLGVDTTARLMRRMGFVLRVSGSELYSENYIKNGLGQLSRARQTCE